MAITINGTKYNFSGSGSVAVANGRVYVDGKEIKDFPDVGKIILVQVQGDVKELSVDTCQALAVHGNVGALHVSAGDVDVDGNVTGDMHVTSGDVRCKRAENVQTMSGDVTAETIKGSVRTVSGDVSRRW